MRKQAIGLHVLLGMALIVATGCETLTPVRTEEVSQAALVMQHLRQDVERLKVRSDEEVAHRQNLESRLEQRDRENLRRHQETQQALADMRREVDRLHAERERLREEIVADLSERMSRMLASQTARAPTRGGAQSGYEHVVQAGQTLSEMARAYGVTVEAILKANAIQDPNRIREGQTLFIPE